jgi:hypothetical protein
VQITRSSSIETAAGPDESFTVTVYLDRAVRLDGVPEGYRAMNVRKAIKVMVRT